MVAYAYVRVSTAGGRASVLWPGGLCACAGLRPLQEGREITAVRRIYACSCTPDGHQHTLPLQSGMDHICDTLHDISRKACPQSQGPDPHSTPGSRRRRERTLGTPG